MTRKSKQIRKVFTWLLIAFVVVFLLRWGYEVFFSSSDVVIQTSSNVMYSIDPKSNIASDRVKQKGVSGETVMLDQKYDKTATMASNTDDFDGVNDALRDVIEAHEAVIQMENLSGLKGQQTLEMSIGVMPEQFDAVVDAIKALGELRSFKVTKIDKTDEYRTLMAEIETLEKTRDAYNGLKQQGGEISDLLMLEDKILEVEAMLQALGVDAGLFSTENSFCTVNYSLQETNVKTTSVRFLLSCALTSFFWTLAAFFVVIVMLLVGLGCAYAIVSLTDKTRGASARTQEKKDQEDENLSE